MSKARAIRWLPMCAAVIAATIIPALPAQAEDVRGHAPTWEHSCGAFRDFPSQWQPISGHNPCGSGGFSYVLTSGSVHHTATWDFTTVTADLGVFEVDTWIPSLDASQEAEYDYQLCGSSTWVKIGDLNQSLDNSDRYETYYAIGDITLHPDQGVCTIRVVNVGSASWDLAEDALGLYRLSG